MAFRVDQSATKNSHNYIAAFQYEVVRYKYFLVLVYTKILDNLKSVAQLIHSTESLRERICNRICRGKYNNEGVKVKDPSNQLGG
jgi:hypothetical protein